MPAKTSATVLRTDADGLAANTEAAVLVLDITRREIESGSVASALERLLVMIDNREAVYLYREALLIQVTGYEADRRELPEIPEVRAFFARLTREWPHWLWFLHRQVGAIPLLLALLCRVKIHRAAGAYGTEFIDPDELQRRLMDLFGRGNALFKAFDIPNEDAEASANSAIADIFGS